MSLIPDLDDAYLPEEHRMMRSLIRRFVEEEVKPHGERWEADGRVPREVYLRLGELGVLGMGYPTEYGGGMGLLGTVLLGEELGRSTFGGFAGAIALQTDMGAMHLAKYGSDALRQKYLPGIISGRQVVCICATEPDAGSDVAGLKTSARRDGDHYVVNGSKMFITSGIHGDLYLVLARTDPGAKGSRGLSLLVLEKGVPGFSVSEPLKKTGWLSSDTAQLFFDNVRVPAENLIGEENKGFYYTMEGFERERVMVGALSIGQSEAALELTMEWLKNRKAFSQTLWDLHGIKLEMARLACELSAAKTLLYHAARNADQGQPATALACMVKAHLPPLLNRILYQCVQYHGGMGFMNGTPVERIARDARVLAIGGGATEVMLLEVAKRM